MASIELSTTYLGLRLSNPFMTGASPLPDHLDTARRLEDAGCAAIVLHSLFEEQISQAETGRIHHRDPLARIEIDADLGNRGNAFRAEIALSAHAEWAMSGRVHRDRRRTFGHVISPRAGRPSSMPRCRPEASKSP